MKHRSNSVKLGSTFQLANLIGIDDAEAALQTLDHNLPMSEVAILRNFNRAYLIITQKVRQALKKQAFKDAPFMEKFDAQFVYYYIRALEAHSAGRTVPKAWQIAFNAAASRRYSPVICMALGINAHVNNDIPQALLDTSAGPKHYGDYLLVNDIIRESIYEVIDDLDKDKGLLSPKHRLLKPCYKFFMGCLIRIWRYNAWKKYQKLSHGSTTIVQVEISAGRKAAGISKLPL